MKLELACDMWALVQNTKKEREKYEIEEAEVASLIKEASLQEKAWVKLKRFPGSRLVEALERAGYVVEVKNSEGDTYVSWENEGTSYPDDLGTRYPDGREFERD